MISDKLKPAKITDIISRAEEYISAMRKMEKDDVMKFIDEMANYVSDWFNKNELNIVELKRFVAQAADDIYCQLMQTTQSDIYLNGYYGFVLYRFFYEAQQKGVFIFFVIDNVLRDDRFKLLVQMYATTHFRIIHPYEYDGVKAEYKQEFTKLPTIPFSEVEKKISEAIEHQMNIVYVEKDDSVNYVFDAIHLAERLQLEYACIFRNKKCGEPASFLTGSFGNLITNPIPLADDNRIFVWCNRENTGIWVVANNGRLINAKYDDFKLPPNLIERFKQWGQQVDATDVKSFNGCGLELAMDTKRYLGDKYRIFYRYSDNGADIEIVPK